MSDKLQEPIRGTALSLYNRFAELMLVVGLDENTGLIPLRKEASVSSEFVLLFSSLSVMFS